ncbi:MAG: antibiotic biosynthesis monooxygenase [Dehalococcoidia bacterium]
MPYVRISLMRPKHGHEDEVNSLIDRLTEYYQQQPGYVTGYRLRNIDGSGRVGRLGVWERHEDAEHAATTDHDLALRSQLNLLVEDTSHEEYSFEGLPTGAD